MGEAILRSRLPLPSTGADADALFRLGLRLSTGLDSSSALDRPAALALFELAARRGSIEAKVYRHELSEEMDSAEIDEALQLAREWNVAV